MKIDELELMLLMRPEIKEGKAGRWEGRRAHLG
jgi:hypothetical protein